MSQCSEYAKNLKHPNAKLVIAHSAKVLVGMVVRCNSLFCHACEVRILIKDTNLIGSYTCQRCTTKTQKRVAYRVFQTLWSNLVVRPPSRVKYAVTKLQKCYLVGHERISTFRSNANILQSHGSFKSVPSRLQKQRRIRIPSLVSRMQET